MPDPPSGASVFARGVPENIKSSALADVEAVIRCSAREVAFSFGSSTTSELAIEIVFSGFGSVGTHIENVAVILRHYPNINTWKMWTAKNHFVDRGEQTKSDLLRHGGGYRRMRSGRVIGRSGPHDLSTCVSRGGQAT